MRRRDLVALEFPRLCARVADFAASEAGKQLCLDLQPTGDRSAAEEAIERTWQCLCLLERYGAPPLHAFRDIRVHLRSAAHEGFVLDGAALVEVRTVLRMVRAVGAFFREHAAEHRALAYIPAQLQLFLVLETSLTRALDDDGAVLDQASDELAGIRATIRRLRETLTKRLDELVGRRSMADVVSDTYVTLRNDRFVVPVRTAAAARVPGVVQDRSVSGETLFVEPLFAVELNNQLLMAVREEEAIVRRILADLTALVRAEHTGIAASVTALIAVDCMVARAKFGQRYECTRPEFTSAVIDLRAARHPGLLFTGRPVTPVDLILPADRRVLVITGPNTGGKTVAVKTLGLCALLAQSGLLVPAAEGAKLPCLPAIFTDMGDEQDIERNLSTFSAHIANLCEILASDADGPLILLDEPGVGTDPEEGAALAIGLMQHFEQRGARLAITTHYQPVKLFALGRPSCAVAAVDFDVESLTPHYHLVYHSLGRSLALPIAQRLGLPEPVLAAARAAQSDESRAFSAALEKLEDTRGQLEDRQRQLVEQLAAATARASALATQDAESQRMLAELRQRRRTVWTTELREAREFMHELKKKGRELLKGLRGVAEERAAFERYIREQEDTIRNRTAAPSPVVEPALSPGPLQQGDTVEVGSRGIQGQLLSLDGARAWIQSGTMRFEVPAAELRRVSRAAAAAPAVQIRVPSPETSPAYEITVIGLRTREALTELDSFLDRAAQTGQASVRIIHGVGSGALRRAIHDYLSNSPYCAGFLGGEGNEGGAGVTVAMMNV